MDNTYKLRFCILREYPLHIMYDGKQIIVDRKGILLKAKTQSELLSRLKGTDSKVISDIRSIVLCTR